MNHIAALIFFSCAIILAGCNEDPGSSDDSQSAEFINTTWMLQSIDVPDSASIEVDPDKPYTIQFFEDLRLSGINDCNDYEGIYTISENNSLSFESLSATRRGCRGESIDLEYFPVLQFVHSYEIRSNMLRLFYDDNNSALNYLNAE